MAPQSKKAADKHPREPFPEYEHMEFGIREHQVQFERLSKLKFGRLGFLDLSALREI